MTSRILTKPEWIALGNIFEREIEGTLPLQSKRAIYRRLEEDGQVERVTIPIGRDCLGAIEVSGWVLTQRGRYLYCMSCERFAPEESAPASADREGE